MGAGAEDVKDKEKEKDRNVLYRKKLKRNFAAFVLFLLFPSHMVHFNFITLHVLCNKAVGSPVCGTLQ